MKGRTFYKFYYDNNYVSIELFTIDIPEYFGNLTNIYITNNRKQIKKYEHVFIKLDNDALAKKNEIYDSYTKELCKILLDLERNERIMDLRNGNFGEYRYNLAKHKIDKFSYDNDGSDTKVLREEENIPLNYKEINLEKDKEDYQILDQVRRSSFEMIDADGISYLIEIKHLEPIMIERTKDSLGDYMNISMIKDDTLTTYFNVFADFNLELLLGSNIDSEIYKNKLGELLSDKVRNTNVITYREGSFGIILYDNINKTIRKYFNQKQISNIKAYREMSGELVEIKEN